VPYQPGVDGAGQRVPGLGRGARTGEFGEQPLELRRAEIARERQAGLLPEAVVAAVACMPRDQRVGARVLPDERVVQGSAAVPIPDEHRLALVRDPDRGQVGRAQSRARQRVRRDLAGVLEDLERIVLDPTRPRKDLRVLALRRNERVPVAIEHDEPGAGGALVDRSDVLGHGNAFLLDAPPASDR
jgi:hypothetical protein